MAGQGQGVLAVMLQARRGEVFDRIGGAMIAIGGLDVGEVQAGHPSFLEAAEIGVVGQVLVDLVAEGAAHWIRIGTRELRYHPAVLRSGLEHG